MGEAVFPVRISEVFRYLGIPSGRADEETETLAERALRELRAACSPAFVRRDFPILALSEDEVDLGVMNLRSRALAKNLRGCGRVILFAATLGGGADFLLRRYQRTDMRFAAVCQAAAAAMIEGWCDELNGRWAKEAEASGCALRPRFSPGYGDLSLESQREICLVLDANRRAGIALTESLLMIPSKSVTAFIGVCPKAGGGEDGSDAANRTGCAGCHLADCAFRRK